MIVVAIIELLASLAVPSFMRTRKRSEASMCLQDLRILNDAITQYAMENSKTDAQGFDGNVLRSYVDASTSLYGNLRGNVYYDRLGNYYYSNGNIGTGIGLEMSTFNALSDVAPVEFWSPYSIFPVP
jgi:type II secretory pathway pseudopilin PulG